jgi:hypothetical protein
MFQEESVILQENIPYVKLHHCKKNLRLEFSGSGGNEKINFKE